MRRLIMFDVDQTLLSTRGGDRVALNTAFKATHGIADAFQDVSFAGRMDLAIFNEVYAKWGLISGRGESDYDFTEFKSAYFSNLKSILTTWDEGNICPGIPDLLFALSKNPTVDLGLATGNFREAAFIKLGKYGLESFFVEGGFGGDHIERTQVVADSIKRCQQYYCQTYRQQDIFVVGDSPSDVEAGHANGIQTLAVATGFYSVKVLSKLKPSRVMQDLSNTRNVLAFLLGR